MGAQDLIREAFKKIDLLKRHRALMDIEGYDKKQYHELQTYKALEQLELHLRAINKELRDEEQSDSIPLKVINK